MSETEDTPDGWTCLLSDEVAELLSDVALPADVFSAVIAATVAINECKDDVPGSTASDRWPAQRRLPLGAGGALGIAEYVMVADAEEPYCVITRVQLY
ncbi:hypothetical protein ACIHFE_15745 [Streptomyces sp. NPDC052396]|uniref:hypothetical protein n=1 Tax=Streptomyces sp. NPDC052396 TaxID=3365689 RepID=UPI0037D62DD4